MAQSTVAKRKEKILKLLNEESIKTIILVGERGVGKTWTARGMSIQAIKEKLFDISLWVFLSREYDDDSLRKSIACQLCLLPTTEEWEGEDENGEAAKKEEEEEEEEPVYLKHKISESLGGKRFLLILDDVGNKMNEESIMFKLKSLLDLDQQSSYKIIITTTKSIERLDPTETRGEDEVEPLPAEDKTRGEVEVEPLSVVESLPLLGAREGTTVYDLAKSFLEKTRRLPAGIVMMAKALSYFGRLDSGLSKLRSALEEASDNESYNLSQLIRGGYDNLPYCVLIDLCRSGSHLLRDRGSVHYNELIAYWIMEGYIGCTNSVEEAYERGHCVLRELMDCQMLKKSEAGYVILDGTPLDIDESQLFKVDGTGSLGLATVFDGTWEGLGRITQMDGMIRTLCGKREQKLVTLLLDGNRLSREVPNKFFESRQGLRVLSVFNPDFKLLPQPVSTMKELLVLVLRGCKFLENVNHFEALKTLGILEISGASSLDKMPDDIFAHMPQLRSLNLSSLQINQLPLSLYDLKELCWLILRGCSLLGTLKSLKKLTKLMVLDLSGATSLKLIQDKSFKDNPKLQTLNFSQTRIQTLPKFLKLGELAYLSLRDCRVLERLPSTQTLPSLQILDLSGAKKFNEFYEQSLGSKTLSVSLKMLDLSETAVTRLPSNIGNPRHLILRKSKLENLPWIESLKDVEVLDLSGTHSLKEIDDKFFESLRSLRILNLSETNIRALPSISNLCKLHQLNLSGCSALTAIHDLSFEHMSRLQKLDLSGTKIECVPSLSNLSSLRCLLLEDCTVTKVAPLLESLSNLEELNLSGMSCLKDTGADFLKYMTNLQILNLSGTMLEWLPSMSSLNNLEQLFLTDCQGLKTVPDLDVLTKLEVLDLSGTAVTSLPSFNNFTNLRRLLLRDCSSLEDFKNLEILGVLGVSAATELPYGISKLTHLDHLDLPNMNSIEGSDILGDRYQWGISSLSAEVDDRPHISVNGTIFVQLLKRNLSLLTSLTRFHFRIHPTTEGQNRNELIFRDIHFKTKEFAHFKEQRSLEIYGFHDSPPKGIEDILGHVDCLFLVDNTFERWLSDLGATNLKVIKGCWIDRCTNMESVFHAEKADDITTLKETLECLSVSNAINLTSICSGSQKLEVFQNLKSLYIDCCPKLSTLFSSSPPKNLQVLQIKFCDKLETIFEQSSSSSEHGLPNLQTLHLLELPELKSIGCPLPSLHSLKVCECPNLQKLEENIERANGLQVLWISNITDLKSIYSGNLHHPESLKNLKSLTVETCPELVNVTSSPQPPENLETLRIKSCAKLETVFEHSGSADYALPSLHTLDLQQLPKLEKIGAQFPSLQDTVLVECPNCREPPR